jgi:large subunit ribosomal protein L24
MKIKKGDNVMVITGKDKGKKGAVVKALPKEDKVIVAGVNIAKKHTRPRKAGEKGQVVDKTMGLANWIPATRVWSMG